MLDVKIRKKAEHLWSTQSFRGSLDLKAGALLYLCAQTSSRPFSFSLWCLTTGTRACMCATPWGLLTLHGLPLKPFPELSWAKLIFLSIQRGKEKKHQLSWLSQDTGILSQRGRTMGCIDPFFSPPGNQNRNFKVHLFDVSTVWWWETFWTPARLSFSTWIVAGW